MEPVNYRRPHRAIIRCKAKMQLLRVADSELEYQLVDEALIREIAGTLFHSVRYQLLYEQCASRQAVKAIDRELVDELVEIYQQISSRRSDPTVQRLNALLQ